MSSSAISRAGPVGRPGLGQARLRPAVYAALVVLLPALVVGWAVGRNSARDVRRNANASVAADAQDVQRVVNGRLAERREAALWIANSPGIQRALGRRESGVLARFADRHVGVSFVVAGKTIPARPRPTIARQTAVVTLGGKSIGKVVVGISRQSLLSKIRSQVDLSSHNRLFLTGAGTARAEPTQVRIAGHRYRAVGVQLSPSAQAVVARPASVVDHDVRNVWLIVAAAVLTTVLTVALIALATAPLITRGRMAQRERSQALEVLTHVGDGVAFVDREGEVRFWNRAAERITGLPREMVWGTPLAAVPGLGRVETEIPVGEEGRVRPRTLPVRIGDRELQLALVAVEVEDGTVYTFGDVTEEHRLEQLKTDFLSTVSHQLRTPLTGLYGAVLTLRERAEALPGFVRDQLLRTVGEEAEKLVRIVEDVLVASGLESDRLPLMNERFDPVALAHAVVDDARSRHSTDRIELDAPKAADVIADPMRTRQVLEILVDNGITYSTKGPVRVAVAADDGVVRFTVRDEGPGIADEEQERIFDKFYRSDAQMQTGVGGTGLGLYICRELVLRMGGRMWVESTPGKGASFSFELPSVSLVTP